MNKIRRVRDALAERLGIPEKSSACRNPRQAPSTRRACAPERSMVKSYSAAGATRRQRCCSSGSQPPARYTHRRAVMVLPRLSPRSAFSASVVSSVKITALPSTYRRNTGISGISTSAEPSVQSHSVCRDTLAPCRARMRSGRASGQWSAYFDTIT
jgi:hypothetical protein